MHDGALSRARAADLDAEPLLLPDAHPHQGRAHRLQVRGSGLPARLDPAHSRPRRRRRTGPTPVGLALWLRLAEAVGLDREEVASCRRVLPGVRFACDAYVTLCRESPLVVAVASSLTEMFAPDLMSKRIAAWEQHYPWVGAEALALLPRPRPARAPRRRRGAGVRGRERHVTRAAGALRGGAGQEDRDPLAPGRLRAGGAAPRSRRDLAGDSRSAWPRTCGCATTRGPAGRCCWPPNAGST